jgi:hypothetical protein
MRHRSAIHINVAEVGVVRRIGRGVAIGDGNAVTLNIIFGDGGRPVLVGADVTSYTGGARLATLVGAGSGGVHTARIDG